MNSKNADSDDKDSISAFSEQFEIDPYTNGVHSLAAALQRLGEILDGHADAYVLKDVVLRSHHALETLFKDILFGLNPAFVLESKRTVGEMLQHQRDSWLLDDARTIAPLEALERLVSLGVMDSLDERGLANLKASIKALDRLRNQIQHFSLNVSGDVVLRTVGNLIPAAVSLLDDFYHSAAQWQPWDSAGGMFIGQPLTRMTARDHFGSHELRSDLNRFFPLAEQVIEQIESRFDRLVVEARQALRGAPLPGVRIGLAVRDHGEVGAPPYMPELTFSGWIASRMDPHRWADADDPVLDYEAIVRIAQPIVVERGEFPSEARCTLDLGLTGRFALRSVGHAVQVQELQDHLRFIRSPQFTFAMSVNLDCDCMYDDHHFHVHSVRELSGDLEIRMESSVFGDSGEAGSIWLSQTVPLSKLNTAVQLHAFVASTGQLSPNYSLDLSIEETCDLVRGRSD